MRTTPRLLLAALSMRPLLWSALGRAIKRSIPCAGAGLVAAALPVSSGLLWRSVRPSDAWVGGVAARMLLALGLLLSDESALAIPADVRLDQLHHARWTLADGAPVLARAMAQSGDGALWIGNDNGLFRFDGVQFQRIQAPEPGGRPFGNVSALLGMPDGSLWIGLRFGGSYHWRDGHYTVQGEAQGLPSERSIMKFALGNDGRVWAGTSDGLFVLQSGSWRRVGAELGHPDLYIHDLVIARDGTLWTNGRDGVFSLTPDSAKVNPTPGAEMLGYLAALADGSVWFSSAQPHPQRDMPGLFPLGVAPEQPASVGLRYPTLEIAGRILADRDGGLWAAHGTGVMRLVRPGSIRTIHAVGKAPEDAQRFSVEQGLSGDMPAYFFEDRDGNVWVSTEQGLDRFRVPRLMRLPRTFDPDALHVAQDGSMLVCNGNIGPMSEQKVIGPLAQAGTACEAFDEEASGRTWWAINRRLWWWHGQQAGELPLPPEAQPVLGIPALKVDRSGTLWVSLVRQGLFRHHEGRWTRVAPGRDGYPRDRPLSMGRDSQGRVWLGYPSGQVALPEPGRVRVWGPEQGLRVGNVRIMAAHAGMMLIGGSEGLGLLKDGKVTMLQGIDGERFESVSGIVPGKNAADSIWVQAGRSILRIRGDLLAQATDTPMHRLPLDRFDHADGLRGQSVPQWPWASAARRINGQLWFSTPAGIFTLDPAQVRGGLPPALELRGLQAEDVEYPLNDGQTLPTANRRLEISYAAINVSKPERVRYRYRLEGLDSEWRQTTARSASYTNLLPGDYTFRVAAANEDGPWSEPGVALRFSIPPAFHQTAWFYALCTAAIVLLAWAAHRWRLHSLLARLRLRNEAQVQERERIARELHDTLLQSTQGLMLTVQSLAERTPADHPDKPRIERVLARADQTLREGRRKVMELRADDGGDEADLEDWLRDLACELSERGPAAVSVRVIGASRCLLPRARAELLSVGREAMLNAQKHAEARRIELLLAYEAAALRLQVTDDGRGMTQAMMDGSSSTPGHWGLAGMRERAAALGAQLSIRRQDEALTVLEFVLPAARAYGQAATQTEQGSEG